MFLPRIRRIRLLFYATILLLLLLILLPRVIRVRVVPREVPTSRLPRGRIDDPIIPHVVVVRQIATEEAQIEIAVDVSVDVGFSSNPRHDRIHLRRLRSPGCDRPARTTRRSATPRCCTRSLSLVVHDKDVRASIEEQSHDVLPPPRGREEYGTLAVIVTARRDDIHIASHIQE